mgnify:CR=1 FL=1
MRDHAINIFQAAVQAVQPQYLLPRHIQWRDNLLHLGSQVVERTKIHNVYVIGAGKAAAAMARETENILGEIITDGIIVTKYDHGLPLQYIQCREAGHPLPDAAGVKAGEEITNLLQQAGEHDIVIALISGGASALMVDCPPGCSLTEVQKVFGQLLACGAAIGEMNIVRKHLSPGIKGGQLVRSAHPATIISFILSDVPGDELDIIASGPTVPDRSSSADAWQVLEKYDLVESLPKGIRDYLQKKLQGEIPDTPSASDPIFKKTFNFLIGTNDVALQAAQSMAKQLGFHTKILSPTLTGEARLKAAELAEQIVGYNGPRPACLLLGGETTVSIKGKGLGGRNQEFALAALTALHEKDVAPNKMPVILAAGTDGTDGPTPAAGAVIDKDTLTSINVKKLSPQQFLAENDSFHFFQQAGGHIITGPTQTNVMDVVVVLIA